MTQLVTIAHMRNDFPAKFGLPRQSGLVERLPGSIVFTPPYRQVELLRGLESFSHLWLLWGFSAATPKGGATTVRPPRLGGNTRMGVFATRAPFRPNAIGLSSVRLDRLEPDSLEGPVVHVLGADLMDGTPIYDIKPYLPYTDSHPEASGGFAGALAQVPLEVRMDDKWACMLPQEDGDVLRALLAQDPRPSYQEDPGRVYGMAYGEVDVKFRVSGGVLTVLEVCEIPK